MSPSKKSMAKLAAISFLSIVLMIALIFIFSLVYFSAEDMKTSYGVGEKIKFSLDGEYKIKINT